MHSIRQDTWDYIQIKYEDFFIKLNLRKYRENGMDKKTVEIVQHFFKKLEYIFVNAVDCIIDLFLHVNTTKAVKLDIHDNEINYMYEPFPYKKIKKLFKRYSFIKGDGFVDIGCGKGRVLIGAVRNGCGNVYGVDISKTLLNCAEKNMLACKKRRGYLNYYLMCMDAKDYVFSPDINKVFFYNPFSYKIFIRVIKALKKSIEDNPRNIMLFLAGPEFVSKYMANNTDFEFAGIEQQNVYVYRYVAEKNK